MADKVPKAYSDALVNVKPAPAGIAVNTATVDAKKMLAWWSVKQATETDYIRVGQDLVRFTYRACPKCSHPLTAQLTKLTAAERAMAIALLKHPAPEEPEEEPEA